MAGAVSRVVSSSLQLPPLFAPDRDAAKRFVEFFTANIRNPNTRRAYARAAVQFAAFLAFAHRAFCAAAILARASGERWRFLGAPVEAGRPGPRFVVLFRIVRAC